MNTLVAIGDFASALGFLAALLFIVMIPKGARSVGPSFKHALLAALGLYLFVGISNVFEHMGVTSALDVYEDYAEVLFVPLVAYILYSRSTSEQLEAALEAEERIRTEHELLMGIVDTTPAGILVVDDEGYVSFANDVARRMVALVPVEGDESRWRTPCSGSPDVMAGGQLSLAAIVKAAPVTDLRQSMVRCGIRATVAIRATQLEDTPSGRRQAVLVMEDVTEQVKIERELAEYRTDLEQIVLKRTGELLEVNRQLVDANAARQEFFANVSHELRTPLNSIIGFTDLILKELSGPITTDQRKQLSMVRDSSHQLLSLVNDVLDLARLEAGHGAVSTSTFDIGTRIAGLVASMSAVAETRGVALACGQVPTLEVTTDSDKLGQIVRNLVSNAIKFTDPGGAVTVYVERDGNQAVVSVEDTGIGIAPEHLDRVFDVFIQVESPDRESDPGTGLGLAICRELASLLGGSVGVTSALGEGSTFTLRLPCSPNPA